MVQNSGKTDALQAFWSAGRQKRQKRVFFLELPGGKILAVEPILVGTNQVQNPEIRNQIYSYVYDKSIVLDLKGKAYGIKEASVPEAETNIVIETPLGSRKPLKPFGNGGSVSALYICNRQISKECLAFLYCQVILLSRQASQSMAFFRTVRASTSQHLRHLQLHHSTYGDPKLFEYRKYKAKHDRKWAETCMLAVMRFPNLTSLCINLCVNDTPYRLDLKEKWIQPLLFFERLQHLKTVEVHIFSCWRRATEIDKNNLRLWQGSSPQAVRQLIQNHHGNVEIHELFGAAIAKKILGFCDDCALEEFVEAINEKWWFITHQSYWVDWIRQ